jgi:PAS domain S-box-containing protein
MNAEVILELLNYTNAYVVVLDFKMNIRFVNIALANRLGFENGTELINKCWLDFIPEEMHGKIKIVHKTLLTTTKNDHHEFVNEILDINGNVHCIKWLNTAINHTNNLTFSFGIPQDTNLEAVSESDIRSQFHSVIKSDKQMIKSLKKFVQDVPKNFKHSDTCDMF